MEAWLGLFCVSRKHCMERVERIRGRALQRLRHRLLSASPICVRCRTALATEVDHILALANGGGNEDDNLQCLCAGCHELKTLEDLGQKQRMDIGEDGWPVPAVPRGPRWRRAG